MAERVPRSSVNRARAFGAWFAVIHPELSASEIGRVYNESVGGQLRPRLLWHVADAARAKRRELSRRGVLVR